MNGNSLKNIDTDGLDWATHIKDYQARRFVIDKIRPTLSALTMFGNSYRTIEAEQLLLGTALKESGHFRWRKQLYGGPGRSYYQIEIGAGRTFNDVYNNYLNYRTSLRNIVNSLGSGFKSIYSLTYNDYYATAIARIIYRRKSGAIPKTFYGQSRYWKSKYNTFSGSGTSSSYRWYWRKYVGNDTYGFRYYY